MRGQSKIWEPTWEELEDWYEGYTGDAPDRIPPVVRANEELIRELCIHCLNIVLPVELSTIEAES